MGTSGQIAVYAVAAVVVLAVVAWRLWPVIKASRAKQVVLPAVLDSIVGEALLPIGDSDRKAPQGTREWIREVLAAVDGAPDSLKLEILADPATTVAAAQKRYIDHLRQTAATP